MSGNGKWVAYDKVDFKTGQRLYGDRPGSMSIFIGEVDAKGQWENVVPAHFNHNEYATRLSLLIL